MFLGSPVLHLQFSSVTAFINNPGAALEEAGYWFFLETHFGAGLELGSPCCVLFCQHHSCSVCAADPEN